MDFARYISEITALLTRLSALNLPYPLGFNEVLEPESDIEELRNFCEIHNLRDDFVEFYCRCNGISMNNVWNGYWIFGFDDIDVRQKSSDINYVNESSRGSVIVFGADGGGGRFAVAADGSNTVFYLPSSGSVHNSVWTPATGDHQSKIIASNFTDFCCKLKGDVEAFVHQKTEWKYVSDC